LTATRQVGRGLGLAVLMTVATAVTSHLVEHGRDVPYALTDSFLLGYYLAAGLAAVVAIAAFALRPDLATQPRGVTPSIRVGLPFWQCWSVSSEPTWPWVSRMARLSGHTSRGAYTFVSAPPPFIRPLCERT
jgi:hypothetical protein